MTSIAFGILPALRLSRAPDLAEMGRRSSAGGDESRLRAILVVEPGRDGDGPARRRRPAGAQLRPAGHASRWASTRPTCSRSSSCCPATTRRAAKRPRSKRCWSGFVRCRAFRRRASRAPACSFPKRSWSAPSSRGAHAGRDGRPIRLEPRLRPVSHGYLTAIGARLLEGRELSESDTASGRASNRDQPERRATLLRRRPAAVGRVRQLARRQRHGRSGAGCRRGRGRAQRVARPRRRTPTSSSTIASCWSCRGGGRTSPGGATRWRSGSCRLPCGRGAIRPQSRRPSAASCATVDANAVVDAMVPMDRLLSGTVARPRFYAVMLGAVRRRRRFSRRDWHLRRARLRGGPRVRRRSASAWRSARSARRCWRWC